MYSVSYMSGKRRVSGLQAMSQMARAIGNTTLEKRYSNLADGARHAFHNDFYDPAMHAYVSHPVAMYVTLLQCRHR
jgi:hypothetical protein